MYTHPDGSIHSTPYVAPQPQSSITHPTPSASPHYHGGGSQTYVHPDGSVHNYPYSPAPAGSEGLRMQPSKVALPPSTVFVYDAQGNPITVNYASQQIMYNPSGMYLDAQGRSVDIVGRTTSVGTAARIPTSGGVASPISNKIYSSPEEFNKMVTQYNIDQERLAQIQSSKSYKDWLGKAVEQGSTSSYLVSRGYETELQKQPISYTGITSGKEYTGEELRGSKDFLTAPQYGEVIERGHFDYKLSMNPLTLFGLIPATSGFLFGTPVQKQISTGIMGQVNLGDGSGKTPAEIASLMKPEIERQSTFIEGLSRGEVSLVKSEYPQSGGYLTDTYIATSKGKGGEFLGLTEFSQPRLSDKGIKAAQNIEFEQTGKHAGFLMDRAYAITHPIGSLYPVLQYTPFFKNAQEKIATKGSWQEAIKERNIAIGRWESEISGRYNQPLNVFGWNVPYSSGALGAGVRTGITTPTAQFGLNMIGAEVLGFLFGGIKAMSLSQNVAVQSTGKTLTKAAIAIGVPMTVVGGAITYSTAKSVYANPDISQLEKTEFGVGTAVNILGGFGGFKAGYGYALTKYAPAPESFANIIGKSDEKSITTELMHKGAKFYETTGEIKSDTKLMVTTKYLGKTTNEVYNIRGAVSNVGSETVGLADAYKNLGWAKDPSIKNPEQWAVGYAKAKVGDVFLTKEVLGRERVVGKMSAEVFNWLTAEDTSAGYKTYFLKDSRGTVFNRPLAFDVKVPKGAIRIDSAGFGMTLFEPLSGKPIFKPFTFGSVTTKQLGSQKLLFSQEVPTDLIRTEQMGDTTKFIGQKMKVTATESAGGMQSLGKSGNIFSKIWGTWKNIFLRKEFSDIEANVIKPPLPSGKGTGLFREIYAPKAVPDTGGGLGNLQMGKGVSQIQEALPAPKTATAGSGTQAISKTFEAFGESITEYASQETGTKMLARTIVLPSVMGTIAAPRTLSVPRIQTIQIPKVESRTRINAISIPRINTKAIPRVQTEPITKVMTRAVSKQSPEQITKVELVTIPKLDIPFIPPVTPTFTPIFIPPWNLFGKDTTEPRLTAVGGEKLKKHKARPQKSFIPSPVALLFNIRGKQRTEGMFSPFEIRKIPDFMGDFLKPRGKRKR